MKYLLAACVTLFVCTELLTFTVADTVRICTEDDAKCKTAKIANFTCVQSDNCVQAVLDGKADLAVASANDMSKNRDKLKVVYGVKIVNVSENFVQYYGLAVVKKNTNFNLNQLKDKNSCHTGIGRTVGWKIPVGFLLSTKAMNFSCNQYQSAAQFFGKSCAPGSRGRDDISSQVKDDLCSLCKGTCDTDASTEPYYSYEGAFICMAEGNKDRVGFVKQTTADSVFKMYPGKYGTKDNYQLLCKDGTKKALNEYRDCNIDKRPASAFVTKANASQATVKKIKDTLMAANLADLKTGGIVTDSVENLVPYEDTAWKYVGSYGDHYNSLGKDKDCSGAASSLFVSFSLLIFAIFAFLQLA